MKAAAANPLPVASIGDGSVMLDRAWRVSRAHAKTCLSPQVRPKEETLLQSTLDALSSQIVILNKHGKIIAANEAWKRLMICIGPRRDDYLHWLSCARDGSQGQQDVEGIRAVMRGEQHEYRTECVVMRGSAPCWIGICARRLGMPGEASVVVVHDDISEIRRATETLRDLTGRLLRAQDDERRRIARDLHDSTCQNLLVASLTLNQMAPHLGRDGLPLLGEARAVLDRCMSELRTLSYVLHPPLLDECGLAPALREYLNGFSRRSGIAVELILARDIGRLAPDIENILFRIVQESLTNVHRHSGSTIARVRLTCAHGHAALSVSDRGRGMLPAGRKCGDSIAGSGVGIASMQARVRQFGGRLIIRSGPWGTVVRALVPANGDPNSAVAPCPNPEPTGAPTRRATEDSAAGRFLDRNSMIRTLAQPAF
jgi:signal transduction histidine kinase